MGFIEKAQGGKIKKLTYSELCRLSEEIRNFITDNVSETGGHFASNLGAVEVTVALCYAFDFPKDKIVFDVGHQCYAYKILTGRYNKFDTLRQYSGISGFPKISESEYDFFNSGHSSNSVSVALGLKRSNDLKNEEGYVISFIGDGALTGGMAYEALNDAGRSDSKIIIILNDNEMSISKNVGGIAKHLSNLRANSSYIRLKKNTARIVIKIPYIGKFLYKYISKAKKYIREILTRRTSNIFEELGFYYLGPIDGHDIKSMLKAFSAIKTVDKPSVIHVVTKKGKGYLKAEENPDIYHGVKAFDKNMGIEEEEKEGFSHTFGDELVCMASENENIVAVTAAMPDGTGLGEFKSRFPNRYFDVGIAEGHAVGLCAGLSIGGLVPFFAVYSPFLLRGYDQLLTDICGMNLHAVFAIDRSGLTGADGETHQGIFDTSYLRLIPNLTIFSPATYSDLKRMMNWAVYSYNSPCVIKYPKGKEDTILCEYEKSCENKFALGKAVVLKEGSDVTLISDGLQLSEVMKAARLLSEDKISVEVINLRYIKPLDKKTILSSSNKTKRVVVCEGVCEKGSVYEEISTFVKCDIIGISIPDMYVTHGTISQLKKQLKIDSEGIYNRVKKEFFSENKA